MRDMAWSMPITIHSDATAAIGIAQRKRPGKIRHLDVTDLWIQDKIRSKQIRLLKILGADHVADMFATYVDRSTREKALNNMSVIRVEGRPACAPSAMGA